MRILILIFAVVILFFSVILHEIAHGLMAERHGDSTARIMGRITLNPIPHIDPIGTVLLPGIMILMNIFGGGIPIFGWAKPVPINPRNLNNPKRDMIWIALAGPATNLGIALLLALLFRVLGGPESLAGVILFYGITINLFLAFFNLIPIPPLDGSRILSGILPERYSYHLSQIEPFGFIILIVLLVGGLFNYMFLALLKLSYILAGSPFFMW
ncbi:site-2 protease family protein [Candidatus Aerophobetes bacterium]|nr:site-2 protease family protein [Candidatus Aerophobetes bacterium]